MDKIVFHTSDKEQVKEVFQNIEETHTDFPEPKTDWEPRLLMFKDNHFTSHYLVKSPEHLDEVAFQIIKDNRLGNLGTWDTSDTEKVSDECINLCNNDNIKEEMITFNKNIEANNHHIVRHNRLVDEVSTKI